MIIPSFKFELPFWEKGFNNVIGLDEVGRGAFAGPLVAAAVILPTNFKANGIIDSKLLSAQKREELSKYIIENAINYYVSEISVEYINEHGIGKANNTAFLDCINNFINIDHILVDGFKIKDFEDNKQTAIVHGDSISVSIAAASIIAKVYRDNLMVNFHNKYPEYNFLENKGYGTKLHREAIRKQGLSKIHRTSFKLEKYFQ